MQKHKNIYSGEKRSAAVCECMHVCVCVCVVGLRSICAGLFLGL